MSKTETKGWEYVADRFNTSNPSSEKIGSIVDGEDFIIAEICGDAPDPVARALKIAAALEMYEALKDAADALNACRLLISDEESRDYAGEFVQNARAALAKADGKAVR